MQVSTRFPAAVHILTLLSIKQEGYISSEMIAKSVGTNAVVVRRILALLQQAGLVTTQAGIQGGARLAADAQKVTLLDVYQAVEEQSVFRMHEPHPDCPVACQVKEQVESLVSNAEGKMCAELRKTRLTQITEPARKAYLAEQ